MPSATITFGDALRQWRTERRFSQLGLATEADVSARHLSFLETGKAKPSREMVLHLARHLDLGLRDRNQLLDLAGFAAAYPAHELDEPQMDEVREVLEAILGAHDPNPAMILDRAHDVVLTNAAMGLLMADLIQPDSAALGPTLNAARVLCHPDGIRPVTDNWEEAARVLLKRMDREHAHRPADAALGRIMDEIADYPGVSSVRSEPELPTGSDLLVPVRFRTFSGCDIELISTLAVIGEPFDVTLEELRLETFFPRNTETASYLQARFAAID